MPCENVLFWNDIEVPGDLPVVCTDSAGRRYMRLGNDETDCEPWQEVLIVTEAGDLVLVQCRVIDHWAGAGVTEGKTVYLLWRESWQRIAA